MGYLKILIIITFFLLMGSVYAESKLKQYGQGKHILKQYDQVVRIGKGHCTGFIAGPKLVLSAAHCFDENQKTSEILFVDGTVRTFKIRYLGGAIGGPTDFAILTGDHPVKFTFCLQSSTFEVMDRFVQAGYPEWQGKQYTTLGLYLKPEEDLGSIGHVLIMNIKVGDSGSAVESAKTGCIMGIVHSYETFLVNFGFVGDIKYAISKLEELGIEYRKR